MCLACFFAARRAKEA